jgi:hypothetical protein
MSASQLSGGYAPSSVSLVPTLAEGVDDAGVIPSSAPLNAGAVVPNLLVQSVAGVLPATNAVTAINIVEPPFATYASVGNETQSAFALTVPNGSFGGRTEGALQLISYYDGTVNSFNLTCPKPSGVATAGDNICLLTGSDQSGAAVIPALAAISAVIPNTAVNSATTQVLVTLNQAVEDATAIRFWAGVTTGVGFQIRSNANATANTTLSWFITRY